MLASHGYSQPSSSFGTHQKDIGLFLNAIKDMLKLCIIAMIL